MKLQQLLSYVRRCVDDYHMIDAGDKLAVGLSGGKDSLALLTALKSMQLFYPKPYELAAITISLGFDGFETSNLEKFCDKLEVPLYVVKTDIGAIVFDERKERNPCSLCSKMRKGALNSEANRIGANKVALGHNKDDVLETFFMSLFYEGRIHTFSPVSYLSRTNLYAIRPLIYVPEKDIISFAKHNSLPVTKNPCPVDGYTKREDIKGFVREQSSKYDYFTEKVFGAIARSDIWSRVGSDSLPH